MAEVLSLDKKEIDINDEIDAAIEKDKPIKLPSNRDVSPKDTMDKMVNKMRHIEDLSETNRQVTKELKKEKLKNRLREVQIFFINLITVDTWVKFIQKFEEFIFVIFVDAIFMMILFSLMYILYIIVNADNYDLTQLIFKIGGATIVCILGIVIQVNLPTPKKEG